MPTLKIPKNNFEMSIVSNVSNKKIIFLLPMWGGGGGEKVVSDLSLNLPDDIEKIIVVYENKNYFPYKGKIISLNIKLSSNLILKFLAFLKSYFKFKKIISKEKPDYVISLGSLQNVINILTFKESIVRIDNPISPTHQKLLDKVYPFFVRILFNKAYKIVVVSNGLKKELIENFKVREEKIKVIYNSIDLEKIKKLSVEPLGYEFKDIFSHRVIINIGSLISQKNQEFLIRKFREVQDKIDVRLVILGEGLLQAHLKNVVKELKLEDKVYFLGWQKNPFKFLANSNLFVLSSQWEGFGMALLEAMACGVPVISLDCDFGPREILSSDFQYGILIPPSEKEKLSQVVIEVLLNKNELEDLKSKGKIRAMDFDIKNNINQWEFLYANSLDKNS